jgi:Icc-related predicted phosphoesterase
MFLFGTSLKSGRNMKTKSLFSALILHMLLSIFLISCDKFEFSPYQTENRKRPEELNLRNLQKLKVNESSADDTVTILFSGDSQRFYSSLDALTARANTLSNVDFFVLAGDISDFALLQEFLWVYDRLQKLKMPYFCVVGNHDLTANGSEIYTEMFGPKNFSFSFKDYKFLFHDTNGREYNFNGTAPDIEWLSEQVSDSAKWYVGVSHVPPYDVDFDKALETPYRNLFANTPGFILSLHGHQHNGGDIYYYDNNVRYITSYAVDKSECLLLKLINGRVIKETIYY